MAVHFYRTSDPYGVFSNFSRHEVHVYGARWPTSEHAFQAMKFWPHRPELVVTIRSLPSPKPAANAGRTTVIPVHTDWDLEDTALRVSRLPDADQPVLHTDDGFIHEELLFSRTKDVVMYEVCFAKFTGHPTLRSKLLETRGQAIIEASDRDSYWGWGPDRKGENKLGRVLMAIRDALLEGARTRTALGRPDRVNFVCTAGYPWQTEYGPGDHPDAVQISQNRTYLAFECPHCRHYFEREAPIAEKASTPV